MTEIKVPYGEGFQIAEIQDTIDVEFIDFASIEVIEDAEEMLINAMDNPIGSPRLEDMVSIDDKILIVVNDQTRPGPNKVIVKELISRLLNKGIDKKQIKFIIATGSHRGPTDEELVNMVGSDMVAQFEFITHKCKDLDSLVYLGESLYDVPIYVNKALVECTFCIVTGLISPHHTAGFSGGRKSIVPGLAGFQTLKIHHSLPIRPFEPAMGFIYGNPFHEVALDVAKKTNTKYMINAIQNPHKQNVAFVAGDLVEAHSKGVDICRKISETNMEEKADIVIAGPGGYPRDSNLYQSQKALSVAEMLGNPNCTFILMAEGRDGYGEGVLREWLEGANNPQEVVDRFKKEGFDVGSNKAFMFARALLKGRIIVVSDYLKEEILGKMMLDWAPNLQEAINKALKDKVPNKVIVLPNAVNIIPKIGKGDVKDDEE